MFISKTRNVGALQSNVTIPPNIFTVQLSYLFLNWRNLTHGSMATDSTDKYLAISSGGGLLRNVLTKTFPGVSYAPCIGKCGRSYYVCFLRSKSILAVILSLAFSHHRCTCRHRYNMHNSVCICACSLSPPPVSPTHPHQLQHPEVLVLFMHTQLTASRPIVKRPFWTP